MINVICDITLSGISVIYVSFVKFVVDIFTLHIKTKFVIRMYDSYTQNNDNSYIRVFIVSPVRLYRLMLQIVTFCFMTLQSLWYYVLWHVHKNELQLSNVIRQCLPLIRKTYSCNLEKNCSSDQLSYFRIYCRAWISLYASSHTILTYF